MDECHKSFQPFGIHSWLHSLRLLTPCYGDAVFSDKNPILLFPVCGDLMIFCLSVCPLLGNGHC